MVGCFGGASVLSHSDHYLNSTCPSSNLAGCLPFFPTAGRLISLIDTAWVVNMALTSVLSISAFQLSEETGGTVNLLN